MSRDNPAVHRRGSATGCGGTAGAAAIAAAEQRYALFL